MHQCASLISISLRVCQEFFIFFGGIGTSIGTNWYRKKVSEPVSEEFGIRKKSRNLYRKNLVAVPGTFHEVRYQEYLVAVPGTFHEVRYQEYLVPGLVSFNILGTVTH